MIEWFKNLRIEWQIAIFGAAVAVIGGIIKLILKKKNNSTNKTIIQQRGTDHTAIVKWPRGRRPKVYGCSHRENLTEVRKARPTKNLCGRFFVPLCLRGNKSAKLVPKVSTINKFFLFGQLLK